MKRLTILCLGLSSLVVACGPPTPTEFDDIAAKVHCKSLIKQQLRDPDSYRFSSAVVHSTSGAYDQYGKATVYYRAKNGFGGYVSGSATCTAYDNNGEMWYRAVVD